LQSIAPSQGSSIQFGTGSVGLPSISFIGDSNTGIYSPAADTIAFSEGGTEVARFDSSGNLGIGTSSPSDKLVVTGNILGGKDGTNGFVSLQQGTSAITGFVGFFDPASTRRGYVGYVDSGTFGLNLATDGAYPIRFVTNGTESVRITSGGDFQFNSGYGSVATAYGCRAWANWNGALTGTNAPRAGGNVTSVTRNALGNYTINFTTAMPDANYATLSIGYSTGELSSLRGVEQWGAPVAGSTRVQFINGVNTSQFDPAYGNVAVFR
jgi:hypothetical protein